MWSTIGLCLGPILFTVYINNLVVNVSSYVLKFGDDAKVLSEVSSLEWVSNLQLDLDKSYKWSEYWQVLLNLKSVNVYILVMKIIMQVTLWEALWLQIVLMKKIWKLLLMNL